MLNSVTPKGVEHAIDQAAIDWLEVLNSVTPKGVEHLCHSNAIHARKAVLNSVTPKGVEHSELVSAGMVR